MSPLRLAKQHAFAISAQIARRGYASIEAIPDYFVLVDSVMVVDSNGMCV